MRTLRLLLALLALATSVAAPASAAGGLTEKLSLDAAKSAASLSTNVTSVAMGSTQSNGDTSYAEIAQGNPTARYTHLLVHLPAGHDADALSQAAHDRRAFPKASLVIANDATSAASQMLVRFDFKDAVVQSVTKGPDTAHPDMVAKISFAKYHVDYFLAGSKTPTASFGSDSPPSGGKG